MELFTVAKLTALSSEKRREFEGLLPELVEKIIRNSCYDLEDMRIPGGEDIWINGFDGIIQCNKGDDFVPAGKSVWEFGNSADPMKKAEEDYQKRVKQTSAELRKDITFCFVTTKIWNDSKSPRLEWIQNHSDWKRTNIYDAPVLCARINCDPAICAWLLEKLYDKPLDFTSASSAWDRFSQKTAPPLIKAIFLKERSELQFHFFDAIVEKTNTVVMADTSIEASGFVLSALLDRSEFADRVVVVYDHTTFQLLSRFCDNCIFFLDFDFSGDCLPGKDNKAILRFNRESSSIRPDISIGRRFRYSFCGVMREMGFSDVETDKLYTRTHGNMRVLVRLLHGSCYESKPDWYTHDAEQMLLPLVFLKNFDRGKDKAIIDSLSGVPYSTIEKKYLELAKLEDAPVRTIDNIVSIVSYEETWDVLNPRVADESFDKLIATIVKVLDCCSNHSGDLDGQIEISETIFGNLLDNLANYPYEDRQTGRFKEAIQRILQYFSLTSVDIAFPKHLFRVAYASPYSVLELLQADIKNPNSLLVNWFSEDYSSCAGGVLHALRVLLLHNETARETCRLVLELLFRFRKTKFADRIENLLLDALCLWDTRSELQLQEKLRFLAHLRKRDPDVCDSISLKLLEITVIFDYVDTEKIEHSPREGLTYRELYNAIESIAGPVFDSSQSRGDSTLLMRLLDLYYFFSPDYLVAKAKGIERDNFSYDSLAELNYHIREEYFYHKIRRIKDLKKDEDLYSAVFETWISCTDFLEPIYKDLWMFRKVASCPADELISESEGLTSGITQNRKSLRIQKMQSLCGEYGLDSLDPVIETMEDYSYWGRLLIETFDSDQLRQLVPFVLRHHKLNILVPILNSVSREFFMETLNKLGEEDKNEILPYIERLDCEDWLQTEEQKSLYWSKRGMDFMDEAQYSMLLKYNPAGLLHYYMDAVSSDVESNIAQVMDIFAMLANGSDYEFNPHIHEYELEAISEAVDREYYSDEWGSICYKLLIQGRMKTYTEGIRKYLFLNPKFMADELKKEAKLYEDIAYKFELPEYAFKEYDLFKNFVVTLADNGQDNSLGYMLGRTISMEDGWCPHEFICRVLEELDSGVIDNYVCSGYLMKNGCHTVYDGSEQKKRSAFFEERRKSLSIDYPHASDIMRKISNYYRYISKQDFLYSEIGDYVFD